MELTRFDALTRSVVSRVLTPYYLGITEPDALCEFLEVDDLLH